MRALQLEAYEGPGALRVVDVPAPEPDDASVVVDVRAIGVNYADLLITTGRYQVKPPLPFVPGSEVAGVVSAPPPDSPWSPGDRVAAFVWSGGYAEKVRVPLSAVLRLPESMDFTAVLRPSSTITRRTSPWRAAAGWPRARRCWCSARRAGSAPPRCRSARGSAPAC